jgi:transcription initiation factor TFIIF subunit beta
MVGQVKIKPEPDSRVASPSAMSEDDIYEDAGDLDFGPGQDKAVWLVRIPKFLWDQWEQIGDDEEVELGKVRVEPSENGKEKVRDKQVSGAHVLFRF